MDYSLTSKKIGRILQYGLFEAKNDCIIRKGNGAVSDFAIKMKDETTAKDFENRLRGMSNNEGFIEFFKTIEENAQIRVKEATETLKELLGKDVTKYSKYCGSHKVYRRKDQPKLFTCKHCNNTFSIFKGTIFEDTYTDSVSDTIIETEICLI